MGDVWAVCGFGIGLRDFAALLLPNFQALILFETLPHLLYYLKRSAAAVTRGNWPQFSRVKFDLTRPAERKISEGAAQRRRRGARAQRRTRKSAHVLPGREGVRGKRAVGKGLQAVTFIELRTGTLVSCKG